MRSIRFLILVHFVSLLPLLGLVSFGGSSEAREAHVVRVMLQTGEFVLPLRNGVIPSKPPLYHWFGAFTSALTDQVNEWGARLPSLVFACGTLLLTGYLAAWFVRQAKGTASARKSESVQVGSVIILLLSYTFAHMSAQAMVDMTFTFFVLLAILAFLFELERSTFDTRRGTRPNFAPFWAVCGICILARGPLGLVIPVLIAAVITAALRGGKSAAGILWRSAPGALLALLISLPWYYLAYLKGGLDFVDRQLLFENVQRMTGGTFINEEPFYFYLPSFLRTAFPWSILWLLCLPPLITRWKRGDRGLGAILTPSLAFGVGVLFLSLASGKRHSYLLPLFPIFAVALSLSLHETLSFASMHRVSVAVARWTTRLPAVSTFLLLSSIAIVVACSVFPGTDPKYTLAQKWLFDHQDTIVLWLLAGTIVVALCKRYPLMVRGAAGAGWLFSVWLTAGYAVKHEFKAFDRQAAAIEAVAGDRDLYCIKHPRDELFDPVFYYLTRDVELLRTDALWIGCNGVYLAKLEWYESNRGNLPPSTVLSVLREPLEEIRGRRERDMVLFTCRVDDNATNVRLDVAKSNAG